MKLVDNEFELWVALLNLPHKKEDVKNRFISELRCSKSTTTRRRFIEKLIFLNILKPTKKIIKNGKVAQLYSFDLIKALEEFTKTPAGYIIYRAFYNTSSIWLGPVKKP